MLELNYNKGRYRIKEVWFARRPFEIKGTHKLVFVECYEKVNIRGFKRREFDTSVINLTQPLDELWSAMGKKTSRYAIKRSMRDGAIVEINKNYDEFFKLLNDFLKSHNFETLSGSRQEAVKQNGVLFTAKYDNEIISGNFYIKDGSTIRLLFAASKRGTADSQKDTLTGNASKLLHWEAIKYAKDNTLKEYDLGGVFLDTNHPAYSISKFKMSLGGDLVKRYNYWHYSSPLSYIWQAVLLLQNKIFKR